VGLRNRRRLSALSLEKNILSLPDGMIYPPNVWIRVKRFVQKRQVMLPPINGAHNNNAVATWMIGYFCKLSTAVLVQVTYCPAPVSPPNLQEMHSLPKVHHVANCSTWSYLKTSRNSKWLRALLSNSARNDWLSTVRSNQLRSRSSVVW